MKCFVAVVVLLSCCSVYADEGRVPDLAEVGLSDLQVMSDEDGKSIRGKFALVRGRASASFFGNNASVRYRARNRQFAIGGGFATAGGGLFSEEGGRSGSGFAASGGFAYAGRFSGFVGTLRGGPN